MSNSPSAYQVPEILTHDTINAVTVEATQALKAGQLDFDFVAVREMDSSALAFVFACQRIAKQKNAVLRCLNVSSNLHALAELYGVTSFLTIEAK